MKILTQDDYGVEQLDIYVDDVKIAELHNLKAEETYLLDTTLYTEGIHLLKTIAVDTSGNLSIPVVVSVNFSNRPIIPTPEPEKPKPEPESPKPQPETPLPKPEPEKPKPEPEIPQPEPEKPKPKPETPVPQPEIPSPSPVVAIPPASLQFERYENIFSLSDRKPVKIKYSVDHESLLTLQITNSLGEMMTELLSETQQEGIHEIQWEGKNSQGELLGPGVYGVHLNGGGKNLLSKIVVVEH